MEKETLSQSVPAPAPDVSHLTFELSPGQLCDLMSYRRQTPNAGKLWFLFYVLLSQSDAKVAKISFLHLNAESNLRMPHGGHRRQKCTLSPREALRGWNN